MVNTIEASEIARVPVVDIVRFVWDGRLASVETGCEELQFRSVFVCPEENRPAVHEVISEQGMSTKKLAAQVGLKLLAIERLGTRVDLDKFCSKYVTLQELADNAGTSTKSVSVKFSGLGIESIMDRPILTAKIFRRADL